jgi:rifampin ADP-ribosylating transferase
MGENSGTYVPVTYQHCGHIRGPFFHGTKSAVAVGDEPVAGC